MPRFYSVQSAVDRARLAAGGEPWPGGIMRANLGIGLYSWETQETAERYRDLLHRHGATDLQIIVFEIADADLSRLKKLDLTQWNDDEVNAWMDRHSHYGDAEPHDWEYILRNTNLGPEHFFAAVVFAKLKESP